ncbi:MAG: division/cell wall cluster transcriptional repressor MraZ [Chitinophagaceae bacterium]|nr:division/cell wall cluster transcriptional repressor MraZ [Chitinophagaceae bacterium]
MPTLLGEYEVTLDAKGRFMLPVGFKRQLPEGEAQRFVLSRGLEACLTLYTEAQWAKVVALVDRLNEFNPKARQFKRVFLNGATYVEPDAAGRLLVPKNMLEYAKLSKDLVFSAQLDKVELWDADAFKAQTAIDSEDFSQLANEVLGGDFLNAQHGI